MESADRPGLLVDLVKIITDINITVSSGEFDTEVIISHSSLQILFFFSKLYNDCHDLFSMFCFWDLGVVG